MLIRVVFSIALFSSLNIGYAQDKNVVLTDYLEVADKLYDQYNYNDALNYYEHCYKIDSTLGIVNYRMGVCYMKMFCFEPSAIYFKKSIELEYRKGDAFYNLALNYSSQLRNELALEYFEKALGESPNDKDIQMEIAALKKILNSK